MQLLNPSLSLIGKAGHGEARKTVVGRVRNGTSVVHTSVNADIRSLRFAAQSHSRDEKETGSKDGKRPPPIHR
jgi:hypothetical protein